MQRIRIGLAALAVAGVVVALVVTRDDDTRVGRDAATGGGGNGDPAVLVDDTGRLSVELPDGWSDVRTRPLTIRGEPHAFLRAAPDLGAYTDRPGRPGTDVLLVDGLGRDEVVRLLDETARRLVPGTGCEDDRTRRPFTLGPLEGRADVSTCGTGGTERWVVAATRPGRDWVVVVGIQTPFALDRELVLRSLAIRD